MARKLDLPLPEISAESAQEFSRSWTKFTYVAAAKEWSEEKQLAVIPALLKGKLLDEYTSLLDEEKADMATLRSSLARRAGFLKDPYKQFQSRRQQPGETVSSYLADLKKLYKEAFPAGDQGASILLRKFMSDLRPEIAKQVLLKTEPTTLEAAAKAARNVEQVLGLTKEDAMLVSSLTEVKGDKETSEMKQLVEAVATITAKMDNLQRQLDESRKADKDSGQRRTSYRPNYLRSTRYSDRSQRPPPVCWECGERGHFRRDCPHLNERDPAR